MSDVSRHPIFKQAVEDFLAQFGYGDMVSHEWLETQFGMPSIGDSKALTVDQFRERQFEWLANIEGFKTELLTQHQVCLQSVRGKGYRWVPPHEQTGVAVEEFDRSMKKVFRGAGQKLRNLRIMELSDDQRRANVDTLTRFAALHDMTKRALR